MPQAFGRLFNQEDTTALTDASRRIEKLVNRYGLEADYVRYVNEMEALVNMMSARIAHMKGLAEFVSEEAKKGG